ncbi:MAG: hypothetical protein WCL18_10015 [bacterium]
MILPASIANITQTNTAIQQIDTEIQQLDNLENATQQIRERYQQNIDILTALLPMQRLQEDLQRLGFTP